MFYLFVKWCDIFISHCTYLRYKIDMAKLTVIQAAPLAGKSTQTLYRYIKQGKLSKDSDGKIDTSELMRVFGELKTDDSANSITTTMPLLRHETVSWYKSQIEQLQNDIKELKTESLEREKRLMDESLDREKRLLALLEDKPSSTPESVPSVGGLFNKLFK